MAEKEQGVSQVDTETQQWLYNQEPYLGGNSDNTNLAENEEGILPEVLNPTCEQLVDIKPVILQSGLVDVSPPQSHHQQLITRGGNQENFEIELETILAGLNTNHINLLSASQQQLSNYSNQVTTVESNSGISNNPPGIPQQWNSQRLSPSWENPLWIEPAGTTTWTCLTQNTGVATTTREETGIVVNGRSGNENREQFLVEGVNFNEKSVIEIEVRDVDKIDSNLLLEPVQPEKLLPVPGCSNLGIQKGKTVKTVKWAKETASQEHRKAAIADQTEIVGVEVAPFACTLCKGRFTRKLLLNNHMSERHGVKFVFTEKGRKVKLVRLPQDYQLEDGEQFDPCVKSLMRATGQTEGVIGVLPVDDDSQPYEDDESEDGLGCGFVINIETKAYKKAIYRNEIPFAAFFPANSSDRAYLLKIKDYSGVKQILEPATKADVSEAYSKRSKDSMGQILNFGAVAVVAFIKQSYNASKKPEMKIEVPDNHTIKKLKLFKHDQFMNFAFAIQDNEDEISCDDGDNAADKSLKDNEQNENSTALNSSKLLSPEVSMPTLVAVNLSPPVPQMVIQQNNQVKTPEVFNNKEIIPPILMPQVIKEEVDEETPRIGAQLQETPKRPIRTPENDPLNLRSPRRLRVRKVKVEPMDFEDETEEKTDSSTFAPARLRPQAVVSRRRGRPRKLNFDDCIDDDESPKSKLSKTKW